MRSNIITYFVGTFLFVLSTVGLGESARILAIFPFPGPSQYILVQPYLKALAERGHELTVITAFPQKEPVKRFRDIPVTDILNNYDDILSEFNDVSSEWEELKFFTRFGELNALNVLQNKQVQQLLKSSEHFDVVIVETFLIDALYGFGQHFGAPLIGVSSFGTDHQIDELVGNTSPLSYIPLINLHLPYRMNYSERLKNVFYTIMEWIYLHTIQLPSQVHIYKEYFPNASVDLLDLRRNFSLMLLNQHFTLSHSRPYLANMIEVCGFHINYKPAPLPSDMEAFINNSPQGVIYFSLGSNVKSKDLPNETLQVLMKTFASLPQRVLWKFENPKLIGKPDNVFIAKWFPQPDILAHPNVKLFITHGGLLSTTEAIYHGKPVIGLPVFYDQFLNIENAQRVGTGIGLELKTLNVNDLKNAIVKVLSNSSYAEMSKKISRRFHDRPRPPLEEAIYWTEYVIRYKGAPHLRSPAQDLNFIQYHSIDTLGVLFGALILIFYIIIKLLRCTVGIWVLGGKEQSKLKKKNE